MASKRSGRNKPPAGKISQEDMDQVIARARQADEERLKGYREQSLRIHPWICARCGQRQCSRPWPAVPMDNWSNF